MKRRGLLEVKYGKDGRKIYCQIELILVLYLSNNEIKQMK